MKKKCYRIHLKSGQQKKIKLIRSFDEIRICKWNIWRKKNKIWRCNRNNWKKAKVSNECKHFDDFVFYYVLTVTRSSRHLVEPNWLIDYLTNRFDLTIVFLTCQLTILNSRAAPYKLEDVPWVKNHSNPKNIRLVPICTYKPSLRKQEDYKNILSVLKQNKTKQMIRIFEKFS